MEQHIGVGRLRRFGNRNLVAGIGRAPEVQERGGGRTFHVREGRNVLDQIEVKPFEIGKTKIAPPMESTTIEIRMEGWRPIGHESIALVNGAASLRWLGRQGSHV